MENKTKTDKVKNMSIFVAICIVILLLMIIMHFVNQIVIEFELHEKIIKIHNIILILIPGYYLINYLIEKWKLLKIQNKLVKNKIEIDYHRDIIQNYSPSVLSLIFDGKFEYEKDLMLSILYLENKNFIKIEDNKICLTGKDSSNLNSNLKIILENYNVLLNHDLTVEKDGKTEKTKTGEFKDNWIKAVHNDAINEGLVKKRKDKSSCFSFLPSILLFLEGFFFLMLFLFVTDNQYGNEYAFITFFAFFLAFLTFWLKNLTFTQNQYPKTQKGYEIYARLKGLENYIEDFSNLPEKTIQEMEMWDDFIIYAIMFNKNTNINRQSIEFYEKLQLRANNNQKSNKVKWKEIFKKNALWIAGILYLMLSNFSEGYIEPFFGELAIYFGFIITFKYSIDEFKISKMVKILLCVIFAILNIFITTFFLMFLTRI